MSTSPFHLENKKLASISRVCRMLPTSFVCTLWCFIYNFINLIFKTVFDSACFAVHCRHVVSHNLLDYSQKITVVAIVLISCILCIACHANNLFMALITLATCYVTDPCDPSPCLNGAECKPIPAQNTFGCLCPKNFEGRTCDLGKFYKISHY